MASLRGVRGRMTGSLRRTFHAPLYFYGYVGKRLFYVAASCTLVGVLDGFGLLMFLPLLQLADGTSEASPEAFGKLRFIFDAAHNAGLRPNLSLILAFLCIFFLLKAAVVYLGNAYRITVQQLFVKRLRVRMLESLSNIRYKAFVTSDVGRIQNTMSGEIARLSLALSSYLIALQGVVLVAVYVAFAIVTNPQFSILVTAGGLLIHLVLRAIYAATKRASARLTRESHVYHGLLIQFVSSFKYLKATGTIGKLGTMLHRQILQLEQHNGRLGLLGARMSSVREPSLILVVAAAILIQVHVLGGALGTILVSLLFFYRALSSLVAVQTQWNSFLAVSGSMDNMISFQNELDQSKECKGTQALESFTDRISLRDAVISYNGAPAVSGITLVIQKNETVAFVGESGSGKTTLVNAVAGLIPVDLGIITVDGVSYSEINLETLQRRIGYITQEPVIFDANMFENVTLWDEENQANLDRFSVAIRKASIAEFVDGLKDGRRTELGNNGINISGGQKQRISIARELYKGIELLIMDEATSALDSETERIIQNNIDSLTGTVTMLIVAHRLSTIKNADRIVLMKKGRIDAIGSYDELLQESPYFRRMVELQQLR